MASAMFPNQQMMNFFSSHEPKDRFSVLSFTNEVADFSKNYLSEDGFETAIDKLFIEALKKLNLEFEEIGEFREHLRSLNYPRKRKCEDDSRIPRKVNIIRFTDGEAELSLLEQCLLATNSSYFHELFFGVPLKERSIKQELQQSKTQDNRQLFSFVTLLDASNWPKDNFIEIHQFKMLSLLNLSNAEGVDDEILNKISKIITLKSLYLGYNRLVTDNGLKFLSHLSNLKDFNVNGSRRITDWGIAGFLGVPVLLPHLLFFLDHCDKKTIERFMPQTKLESLNLHGCENITDYTARMLSFIPTLTKLDASLSKISNLGLMLLFKRLPNLQSIGVKSCSQLTSDCLLDFPTSIKELNLFNFKRLNEAALTAISKLPYLEKLDLTSCTFEEPCKLKRIIGKETLVELRLGQLSDYVKDSDFETFPENSKLRLLDLSYAKKISSSTLEKLAKAKKIEVLSLSDCPQLKDEDLKKLAGLTSLISLDLRSCFGLTDEGIESLPQIKDLLKPGKKPDSGSIGIVFPLLLIGGIFLLFFGKK